MEFGSQIFSGGVKNAGVLFAGGQKNTRAIYVLCEVC